MTPPESDAAKRRELTKEFHLEEWKSLREEIAVNMKELRDTERNVVLVCFGLWVWILQAHNCDYAPALILAPISVLLGRWRYHALGMSILNIGKYLRQIENEFGQTELGWERCFRGSDEKNPLQHTLGRTANAFWWGMLFVSAGFSAVIWFLICRD